MPKSTLRAPQPVTPRTHAIGTRLRVLRRGHHICPSLTALAAKIVKIGGSGVNLTADRLSLLELGRESATTIEVQLIARALSVPVERLLAAA